jgi:hypothetical protein
MDDWLGLTIPQHKRLEAHVASINKNIQSINDALDLAKDRIKFLDDRDDKRSPPSSSSLPRFISTWVRAHEKKKRMQLCTLTAAKASLPCEIQLSVMRRQAMIDKIDGKTLRIFRVIWNVPWCFWGGVRSLKLACFEW